MQKPIYPCLWFVDNALEAAQYYCTIFPESFIVSNNPVVTMFNLNGTKFMGLNGGDHYKHTPATSFVVECEDQHEIDHYWEKLGEGGQYMQCGWLLDKYSIPWQIVPSILPKLMSNPDKSQKVMEAFLKMQKFDIDTLLNV